MTLEPADVDKIVLEDEDACLIVHAAGHLGVFIPEARPHSDIAKAVMYFAMSIQKMGVQPFAEMFDAYREQHPEEKMMSEVTLQ